MAIQFARIEVVGRSTGGNACCKGAYNARTNIVDQKTGVSYNFSDRPDNIYHAILLPEHVNKSFLDSSVLMNAVEHIERKHNSQLLKEIVIALPDDKELNLQDKINIAHEIIEEMEWVKNGLAVQVDIHEPHDGEKNWHAHLLVTTRRFTKDGKQLARSKARDLNPEFKTGKHGNFIVPEEDIIHERGKRVINRYFEKLGLENRVDAISMLPKEHVGPVRMRSVLNQAANRNEEKRIAEIEYLSSGNKVLDKVTVHMSVFTRNDLLRAVKCVPSMEAREKLVSEAMSDKSVIALDKDGVQNIQYFTTEKVRSEELKILRLAGYAANNRNVFIKNGGDSFKALCGVIDKAKSNLSEEQHQALSEMILSRSALHVLQGSAGAGKSHVLRQLALIAKELDINVIGLAATHRAKDVLASDGFVNTDTIKGMLFKLHNGRFNLPKYSLIVVDEAGMIGNDDYKELLRVAATRKCHVILSGDERQLASVCRGGMFEVFAGKFIRSVIANIRRQDSAWGKSVAMALSNGDVRTGISILSQENRVKWSAGSNESMQNLLSDWHNSSFNINDRLILAVKNSDVAALNHGVREYLKAEGKLTGEEIDVAGNHYMKGDRILINETTKDLGLINGDIGVVLLASKNRFIISIENNKQSNNSKNNNKSNVVNNGNNSNNQSEARVIEFNPNNYNGFRHAYATTVFKSQGASIKAVFVLHNGFAGIRNSYVALSRNISELNLYVNYKVTNGIETLIKQLSSDTDKGSSLNYLTTAESSLNKENTEIIANLGMFNKILLGTYDFAARNITKLTDKYIPSSEYYNYVEPKKTMMPARDVINETYEEIIKNERLVVGGNSFGNDLAHANQIITSEDKIESEGAKNMSASNEFISNKSISMGGITSANKSNSEAIKNNDNTSYNSDTAHSNALAAGGSAKARFYAKADYAKENFARNELQKHERQFIWDNQTEELRNEARFKAERIARDLLGEPNKRLSSRGELRFGESGKIAVCITGTKAGTWYDFAEDKGGDIFSLVQHHRNCNFAQAADYLKDSLGMSFNNNPNLHLVYSHEAADKYLDHYKTKAEEDAILLKKIKYTSNLNNRAKNIGNKSIAHDYLTKIRNIDCDLGSDIKTTAIFDKNSNRRFPALVAFARDQEGNITGGQQLLLDGKTGNKANVDLPKKSFGQIAGSFVNISEKTDGHNITIIAEGLETALSIKQAGIDARIICSLGISNIKNYSPKENEKIIIAADNDGRYSVTNKTIENAKIALEEKGAFVEIVRPTHEGDFNDVLKSGAKGDASGIYSIKESFEGAMNRHCAERIEEYIAHQPKEEQSKSGDDDRAKIAYIKEYQLPEGKIVDAYRYSTDRGKLELEKAKKDLEVAVQYHNDYQKILKHAEKLGNKPDELSLVKSLIGMNAIDAEKYCANIVLKGFNAQRANAGTTQEAVKLLKAEQEFINDFHKECKFPEHYNKKSHKLFSGAHNSEKNNSFIKFNKLVDFVENSKTLKGIEIKTTIRNSHNADDAHKSLLSEYHKFTVDKIHHVLKELDNVGSIKSNGQHFHCPIKFLDHLSASFTHEYFPHTQLEKIKTDHIERQIEHQKHLEMSKDMGGMSM